jgi:hypothetical protein
MIPGTLGYGSFLWRRTKSLLGLPATPDAEILGEMIAALKKQSEATLQALLETVSLSAPCMMWWADDISTDCDLNDALVLAGLQPRTYETSHPLYLGELHTVMAANNRWLCPPFGCEEWDWEPQAAFYIRSAVPFAFLLPGYPSLS